MTKEITKAIILQEMQDKFALRNFDNTKFLFDETVVPVYNIGHHVERYTVDLATKSITSGPTGYVFFTVPDDEEWAIRGYNVIFMAAGAYKVTGLYVWRRGTPAINLLYIDMKEGQTISYAVNLSSPLELPAKSVVYLYVDDYTSTANLRLIIDVMKVKIR